MSYRQQSKRAAFAHQARLERRARPERRALRLQARLTVRLPPSVDALARRTQFDLFSVDELVQLPDGRLVTARLAMEQQFAAMRAKVPGR